MRANDDELLDNLTKQSERIKRFEQRPSFWRQTVYAGTLGIIFVLPMVGGAYLGRWLDNGLKGYSFSWTINLILLGVIVGGVNAYLFIKDRK